MYHDKIEILKKNYKMYLQKNDIKLFLLNVEKFFNIPIDKTRLEDYSINKFDYNTPSIEITDKKNNIYYIASYTGDAKLLNYISKIQFNNVISISPLRKEEILYYIGSKTPIITKMTFINGDFELTFEREMANSVGLFTINENRMAIRYLQNTICDGRNIKQPLFAKIYSNNNKNEAFEQTYTYSPINFIEWNNTQNKYTYIKNNSVIYGINIMKIENCCNYLHGICFENTNISTNDYFPLNMNSNNYPLLSKSGIKSAMILNFRTENGIYHSLQVYKEKNLTKILFHSKKFQRLNKHNKKTTINKEYSLPNLSDGTISNEEIQNILLFLQSKIKDDIILNIISNELNAFGNKIDSRKKIIPETFDPLDPKIFINKSFEEICYLINKNKNNYFKLIQEQFEIAANINKDSKKIKSKQINQS